MIELKLTEKQYECLIGILSQLEKNHSVTTEFTKNNSIFYDKLFRNVCLSIEQILSYLSDPNLSNFGCRVYSYLLDYFILQKKEIDYARKNLCN